MKKRVGTLYNKPIIEGDINLTTINEIHIDKLRGKEEQGGGTNGSTENDYWYIYMPQVDNSGIYHDMWESCQMQFPYSLTAVNSHSHVLITWRTIFNSSNNNSAFDVIWKFPKNKFICPNSEGKHVAVQYDDIKDVMCFIIVERMLSMDTYDWLQDIMSELDIEFTPDNMNTVILYLKNTTMPEESEFPNISIYEFIITHIFKILPYEDIGIHDEENCIYFLNKQQMLSYLTQYYMREELGNLTDMQAIKQLL